MTSWMLMSPANMQEYVNALSNLLPSGHVQLSESAAQTVTVLTQEAVRASFKRLNKNCVTICIFLRVQ